MKSHKRPQSRGDVRVQVKRGGVTQVFSAQLDRSRGRSGCSSRWKVRGQLAAGGRSLVAFVCGLLLSSLYGLAALFLHRQPLWPCVYVMLGVAAAAAFGMGLSAGVRADVTVLLPTLCAAEGRKLLLFLFASLLLSGPVANTLENTERAAASLLCGAELAANQTQELMQRAATPLFSALDRIREISSNARSAARRVQHLATALMDAVRHVARTLRNVYHFLVDVGDVCNAALGAPYRKCRAVLAEARADCTQLLGEFSFLCDIMDAVLPLCSLARAGELFCAVPSYVAEQLKKHLAAPTVAAFRRMKREFDFNVSGSVTFDLDANSSASVQQVAQGVMEEVSSELQVFEELRKLLAFGGVALLLLSFLRAVRYRRSFLHHIQFDNVYISAGFQELDRQVTWGGGASALPLTPRESRIYVRPLSLRLAAPERRALLRDLVSVLRHLVLGGVLVALDFLVFWILDQVNHQVTGDVVARAPVKVAVQVNGSGYASDVFRDLVASFNVLQGGNISVISRKCLLQPSPPDYVTCFLLGFLLGLALLVSLTKGLVQRCRRLVCAWYHPQREQERIHFLREQILDQRRMVRRAMRRSAARSPGGVSPPLSAPPLLRLPGAAHLEDNMATHDLPHSSGLDCRPCFHRLRNMCVVCMRPLTFQEDSEELEEESEEEESEEEESEEEDGSAHISEGDDGSDSELSEADMMYQDQPGSDDSSASFEDQILETVIVHTPEQRSRTLQDPPGPSRILRSDVNVSL